MLRSAPWRLAPLALIPALLLSCSLDGTWPFPTPTPSPVPPTATALVLAVAATPVPTSTPNPTPTTRPTASPTPPPTASPTPPPTPRPTSTPTATVAPTATTAPPPTRVGPGPNAAPLVVRGKPETGLVAVTCDAGGRDPGGTGSVLDTFKKAGITATFFLTGEWTESNPALTKRMVAEGHELANHTWDHPDLTKVGDQEMLSQLARTEQIAQKAAGVNLTRYVRPPFGAYDQRVLNVLGKAGYEVIYWTLDSGDWLAETSAQDVANRVATKANAGDIVVFHCYSTKTAQAMPAALDGLRSRGLKMGPLSRALGR